MEKVCAVLLVTLFAVPLFAEEAKPLYLHCFRETWGQKMPGTNDRTPATPPRKLVTLLVTPGQKFEVRVGQYSDFLSGLIKEKDGKYEGDINGMFGSSRHGHYGPVELENPFDPGLEAFASAGSPFRAVLSHNRDLDSFLEAQVKIDEARLQATIEQTKKNQAKGKE